MSQGTDFGEGRKTPGFAKGIMLFQTLIILFLSSWIYEEYLNNIYLQAYVNDTFQAYGLLIAAVVIAGALGLAFGLLKILKSTHKQIGELVNQPEAPSLGIGFGSSKTTTNQTAAVDLHPMVAALKADLAHQGSMQPIPPLEVRDSSQTPTLQSPHVPPSPASVKPLTATPSTVITGTMPVLKRVNPDQEKNQNQNSRQ